MNCKYTSNTDSVKWTKRHKFVAGILLSIGFVHPTFSQMAVPYLIGRSGCASATCHGALVDATPDWRTSYSRWEAFDPHARAGLRLLSDRSRRIVAALAPESRDSESEFLSVLQTRCVSCHVTVSAEQTDPRSEVELTPADLAGGVSCESCHGPASRWQHEHTQAHWQGPSRFESHTGMRDTESWLTRTETCARCHVGSRTSDGLIRDMNHDMIAAGHPALRFDMSVYSRNLPPHWETPSSGDSIDSMELQQHRAARWKLLQSAAELSRQRLVALPEDPHVVMPELADFDCFACHHGLSVRSPDPNRAPSGLPNWNPWYTTRLDVPANEKVQLQSMARAFPSELGLATGGTIADEMEILLSGIAVHASEQAAVSLAVPPSDPKTTLAAILDSGSDMKDWYDAAIWYLEVQAALRTLASTGELTDAAEAEMMMLVQNQLQFDHHNERFDSPARMDLPAIDAHRQQLQLWLRSHEAPAQ